MKLPLFIQKITQDPLIMRIRSRIPGQPIRSVRMAGCELLINENIYAERCWSENIPNIDSLIAKKFIAKNDVVLDGGANIGYTALLYVQCGASVVYAFEPVPNVYKRLASLNCSRIIPLRYALGDSEGQSSIYLSGTHNQGHSLNPQYLKMFPDVFGRKPKQCLIQTRALDVLLGNVHFDFMKIDIEGSELNFLRGAKNILSKDSPRIMQMEIYPEQFLGTNCEVMNYFKFGVRAAMDRNTKSLILLNPQNHNALTSEDLIVNPPLYLYSNDENLLKNIK